MSLVLEAPDGVSQHPVEYVEEMQFSDLLHLGSSQTVGFISQT